MTQAQFNLEESEIEFRDRNELVLVALKKFRKELETQSFCAKTGKN